MFNSLKTQHLVSTTTLNDEQKRLFKELADDGIIGCI